MIKDNILKVRERISSICAGINRDPAGIAIVGVSKGRTSEEISQAVAAGITDIGENRVQEALMKYDQLFGSRLSALRLRSVPMVSKVLSLSKDVVEPSVLGTDRSRTIGYRRTPNTEHRTPIRWHMVGRLQTNKVKEAVRIFDLIQSVDTLRLAREIDRQAEKIDKIQDILLEVKTSPEPAKSGFNPEEAIKAVKEISEFKNIDIKGLMTIAPIVDNPQKARAYFKMLKELKDEIDGLPALGCQLRVLSMGMSDDFESAIEEGSTMVRLGRAIFEG